MSPTLRIRQENCSLSCMHGQTVARRGVGFSPETKKESYFESIIRCLGFDPSDPPEGIMYSLLRALTAGPTDPELLHNLIVLDNFMPSGFDVDDNDFLQTLKASIRNKRVTVIVMTPHREAASMLLSQNQLKTIIISLATEEVVIEQREANRTIDPNQPLDFDWNKYVDIEWDEQQLKKAMQQYEDFVILDEDKQKSVLQRFDTVYNALSPEDRKGETPVTILQRFPETRTKISTPRSDSMPQDDGGCCSIL